MRKDVFGNNLFERVWPVGVHAFCTVGVFVRVHGGVSESGVSVCA